MSPADTLRMVGKSLYGARWQSDLATDLSVSDRTMRRWVAGTELPRVDVVSDLMREVIGRAIRLDEVAQALMDAQLHLWRATGPKVPRGKERQNEKQPVCFGEDEADLETASP